MKAVSTGTPTSPGHTCKPQPHPKHIKPQLPGAVNYTRASEQTSDLAQARSQNENVPAAPGGMQPGTGGNGIESLVGNSL